MGGAQEGKEDRCKVVECEGKQSVKEKVKSFKRCCCNSSLRAWWHKVWMVAWGLVMYIVSL